MVSARPGSDDAWQNLHHLRTCVWSSTVEVGPELCGLERLSSPERGTRGGGAGGCTQIPRADRKGGAQGMELSQQ